MSIQYTSLQHYFSSIPDVGSMAMRAGATADLTDTGQCGVHVVLPAPTTLELKSTGGAHQRANERMNVKTIKRMAVGLVVGITVTFLAMLATMGLSALSGAPCAIPMIFSASAAEENGLPAVEFVPNALGLSGVIAVVSVCYTLVGCRRRRR